MLVLVSGATRDVPRFDVGVLVVPSARNRPENLRLEPGRWAIDNGAFSRFDASAFRSTLATFRDVPGCLFVTAPDVVGEWHATLAAWPYWCDEIRRLSFRSAIVAQDGATPRTVPWPELDALFIGGTDAFKLGRAAAEIASEAKARGLVLHMGRVNSRRRFLYADSLGCDTVDGTGFSRWPATILPRVAGWNGDAEAARAQGRLF